MYSFNQLVATDHKRHGFCWTQKPAYRCCIHSYITLIIWLFVHYLRSLLRYRPLSSFMNSGCRSTAPRFAIASIHLATTRALPLRKWLHFFTIWKMVA